MFSQELRYMRVAPEILQPIYHICNIERYTHSLSYKYNKYQLMR